MPEETPKKEKIKKAINTTKNKYWEKIINYRYVIYLGIGILILSYLSIILVDLLNIANARNIVKELEIPILWNYLFTEKGPIEIFQWLFLGSFTVISTLTAFKLKKENKHKEKIFWTLFAVAGAIMLIEDATNVRHFIITRHLQLDWYTGKILELGIFGLIASVPIIAVIGYGKHIFHHKNTTKLIVLGFIFYGSAAFISGPSDLIGVTNTLGNSLYDSTVFIGGEELQEIYEDVDKRAREQEDLDTRYRLVDFLVEESLELLGATMLLASSLCYRNHVLEKSLKESNPSLKTTSP